MVGDMILSCFPTSRSFLSVFALNNSCVYYVFDSVCTIHKNEIYSAPFPNSLGFYERRSELSLIISALSKAAVGSVLMRRDALSSTFQSPRQLSELSEESSLHQNEARPGWSATNSLVFFF